MPELLAEHEVKLEFADLYKRRPIERPDRPLSRHRGWHQSGVLGYIARQVGWLKANEKLEDEIPGRMSLGIMWEEFYFSLEPPSTIWQPGEVVVDEIAMNCDGRQPWTYKGRTYDIIAETKCTEKKIRTGEEFLHERLYLYQGMNYVYGYGTDPIVRWIINFYRGDYCGSGPIIKEFVVRFTQSEIDSAWALMMKFRDRAPRED